MNTDILRDAWKLDPLDLYPNSSHEPMWSNIELSLRRSKFKNKRYFARTLRFIAFFRNLLLSFFSPTKKAITTKTPHLFFALTPNQQAALSPVVDQMNRENSNSAILFTSSEMAWTTCISFVWSLPFFLCLMRRMIRERNYRAASFRWSLDEYWRAYGLYVVVRKWLEESGAKTATVSNDHILLPCVITKAAQDAGITTFYIQHACVTERFPPLRFDYALLEGADSREKYDVVDTERTTICLVGIPKFDEFVHSINHSKTAKSVGVCFSLADTIERCLYLLEGISDFAGVEFIVRPHMGMEAQQIRLIQDACKEYGFEISQHSKEPSFEFLQRIDVLISGTSAIALEAVLLNVTSLNFVLNPESPDWYGFIENGLTTSTDQINELASWIQSLIVDRPSVRQRATRYCASINTPYDGQSSCLAADLIESAGRGSQCLSKLDRNTSSV